MENILSATLAGLTSRALPSTSRPQPSLAAAASSLAYQTQLQAWAPAQLRPSGTATPVAWRLQAARLGKAQPTTLAQGAAHRATPLAACAALLQALQQVARGPSKLSSVSISCSSSASGSTGPERVHSCSAAAAMQGAARTVALEEAQLDLRVLQQAANGHPLSSQGAQQLAGDTYGCCLGGGLQFQPR